MKSVIKQISPEGIEPALALMIPVYTLLIKKEHGKYYTGVGIKINLRENNKVSEEIWMKVYNQLSRMISIRSRIKYYTYEGMK